MCSKFHFMIKSEQSQNTSTNFGISTWLLLLLTWLLLFKNDICQYYANRRSFIFLKFVEKNFLKKITFYNVKIKLVNWGSKN